MPAKPWTAFGHPEPERDYLVLSFLPLKHFRTVPYFMLHTFRMIGQLRKTGGLVGYSLLAQPLRSVFFTLSAWEGEAALSRFVNAARHARTMNLMAPRMGKTNFLRWTLKGSELPPAWDHALRRFRKS